MVASEVGDVTVIVLETSEFRVIVYNKGWNMRCWHEVVLTGGIGEIAIRYPKEELLLGSVTEGRADPGRSEK